MSTALQIVEGLALGLVNGVLLLVGGALGVMAVGQVCIWISDALKARKNRQSYKRAINNLLSSAQSYDLKRRRLRGNTLDQMRNVVRNHQSAGHSGQRSRRS